jgi:diacylglycerol kinase family enzyme
MTAVAQAQFPPLVIANPAARGGRTRGEIETIVAALQQRIGAVDLALTERAGHATALAARAVAERRALVVGVGGDGLLSEVVNGLLGRPDAPAPDGPHAGAAPEDGPLAGQAAPQDLPALGIIAAGTGGDFGRSLGIRPEREAHLAVIAAGRERLVDVGLARFAGRDGRPVDRYFLNVLSAGIGGLVDRYTAALPAAVPGRVAYGVSTLAAVAACRRRRIACRATLADGSPFERVLDTYAVVVANGHTFGGGMRVAPDALVDDGLLDVVLIETPTKLTMLRHFFSIYRGRHLTKPGVSAFSCTRVELKLTVDTPPARRGAHFPLDVDGDALGDVPLVVEVQPALLRVLA